MMDPFTSVLTAVAGRVAGEAAKPLIDKGRRELVRRKIKKPGDAVEILRYAPGPHQGTFSSLGLLNSVPVGVTQAQIQVLVKSNTFTALARQLIAVHLCDAERIYKDRIDDGLRGFFMASLDSRSTEELLQYYGQFFTMLDKCCSDVADKLNQAFPSADVGFTWASQTLLLATLANVEQHVAVLAKSQDRDSSQPRQSRDAEETWRKDYVRAFKRTHERIELPDFDLRKLVHYSEIFVTPNFVMLDDAEEADETRQYNIRRSNLYTGFEELVESVDHTVILGDPGAGKSTASSIIGCQWCKDGRRVCYILKVRNIDFTKSGFDLIKAIQSLLSDNFQQSVPAEYVSRSLLDGSALVVFDGLDELSETISGRLVSNAIEAASLAYPLARFVVTSRRLGYSAVKLDRDIFYEYVLQPFNSGQVESYAKKWFAFRSGGSEELLKSSVADFMQASDSIPDLRQNPLLLAVICLLHAGHSELPRSRPKIYRKCVELLLRTWDSHRGIGEHRWDLDVFEIVLAEIAHLTLFEPAYRNGMTEAQVRDVAIEILLRDAVPDRREAVALAKKMINLCRGRAWMFTDVSSGSPDLEIFSFTHQSFQEYFAAKRLVLECDTPEELAQEIEKCVLDERLEIFSQICISLSSEKFISGPTQVYLHCLDPDSVPAHRNEERLLTFLAKSADIVMLNRSALKLLVYKALRHMVSDVSFTALAILMRSDYRSPIAIRHIIGEELYSLQQEDQNCLDLIIGWNPWLWEVCLREGVATSCRIESLFEGYMHKMVNDEYSCAAEWLVRSLHDKGSTEEERSVCVGILESVARDVDGIGILTSDGPEPPYALFRNNKMARSTSKALARYQSLTPDAVVGLVSVAMAFCEVSAYYQPGVITPADGVIYHFMQARLRRQSTILPHGISVLPEETRDNVTAWCQQDVSFFEWVDHSVETG
ncbi:NACHT domain-containing protein [Streptomyces mirabilis]|uniref:NACHT domain-containing protein n=1 Tax=Streptomyces mirabilis TaxID=68239 RepID=UPI00368DD562